MNLKVFTLLIDYSLYIFSHQLHNSFTVVFFQIQLEIILITFGNN